MCLSPAPKQTFTPQPAATWGRRGHTTGKEPSRARLGPRLQGTPSSKGSLSHPGLEKQRAPGWPEWPFSEAVQSFLCPQVPLFHQNGPLTKRQWLSPLKSRRHLQTARPENRPWPGLQTWELWVPFPHPDSPGPVFTSEALQPPSTCLPLNWPPTVTAKEGHCGPLAQLAHSAVIGPPAQGPLMASCFISQANAINFLRLPDSYPPFSSSPGGLVSPPQNTLSAPSGLSSESPSHLFSPPSEPCPKGRVTALPSHFPEALAALALAGLLSPEPPGL